MDVFEGPGLVAGANTDPEFRLAARFWNATIRLEIGDAHYVLEVCEGAVRGLEPLRPDEADASTHSITAPRQEWERLLATKPEPFYQDLMAAVFRHGFRLEGDPVEFYPYYPAVTRFFELARELTSEAREA